MPVLTALDVLGIQSYVFASNRLRDVVGASALVHWVTHRDKGLNLPNSEIPSPSRIIVAAGGNAILQFATLVEAKRYVAGYSRRLLEKAPGLEIAVAHYEYTTGQLAQGLLALQIKLAQAKLNRRPSAPQLGLSVMQPCAVTGLPAACHTQREGEWVSARIARIREQDAKSRWDAFLPTEIHGHAVRFPDELDQMGRSHGETSLIGVVHVDGNGIGQRIQRWLVGKLENSSAQDEQLIDEYARWSSALDQLGKKVLQAIVGRVISRIAATGDGFAIQGQPSPGLDFSLGTDRDGTIRLPLRPILLGGDDLTFVCDGRIAMDLAATALRAFTTESENIADLKLLDVQPGPVTACAGVALVKAHAPFNRSYQLCEDLCANAKQAKREKEAGGSSLQTGSWLDWHVGTIRPDESVSEIRNRQYQRGKLTCRPYPLEGDHSQRLTWEWLDAELLGKPSEIGGGCLSFRNSEVWGERRNKVKEMLKLVIEGENAVCFQLKAWQAAFPEIGLPDAIGQTGFKGRSTPLLDAIELLDLHLRLEAPVVQTQRNQKTAGVSE